MLLRTTSSEPGTLSAQSVAQGFASAITIATDFAGATAPNPPVGCVILDDQGFVLACEAHQKAGTMHAEAAAIAACRAAGAYDRIHTIIVTLEPCNHFGRTPPCAMAILATPAKTVWIGTWDPNPRVSGAGATILQERGISVRWLEALECPQAPQLLQAARRLVGPFAKWSATNRPWITLKQALTRDGSMIPPAGQRTFTTAHSLILAHKLRRRADAIITGSGTVLADWPSFTVRHVDDHRDNPRRLVILDRRNRTPRAYLDRACALGFEVWLEKDIDQALARLGDADVLEALVEAGPSLVAAFRERDLCDEQIIIRQGIDADAPDIIDVAARRGPPGRLGRDSDVLWHY